MSAKWIAVMGAALLLSGCSFWRAESYQSESPSVARTVQKLPVVEADTAPLQQVTVSDLIQRIEQVKQNSSGDQVYPIANRLAQLRLQEMEDQLIEGEADFTKPLEELGGLLASAPDDTAKAKIHYQLARVQEISGDLSPVIDSLSALIDAQSDDALQLEAHFRRAELLFSKELYAQAEPDFALVANAEGDYQLHARYMLAWVRFKRGDLEGALDASSSAMSQLSNNDMARYEVLKQDLMRVTIVALDYLDGPTTLAAMMRDHGKPDWQTQIYQSLGDWYLSKSRFADSAATWNMFLSENPMHASAPDIALEVMKTQKQAGFVTEITQLEADFILSYGRQSEFYEAHGDDVFGQYESQMRGMLDRYTQRLHSVAQTKSSAQDYRLAAKAYELWLVNFPEAKKAQEYRFLLAEVLQQADGFEAALDQFEQVIAMDAATDFAREAAYAVVVGLGEAKTEVQDEPLGALHDEIASKVVMANLRFASLFPEDVRAPVSQLNAANELFAASRFAEALAASQRALTFKQTTDNHLIAKKLIAHSAFELADYVLAEQEYSGLMSLKPSDAINQKLLATVFKLGEQAELQGEVELAIAHYDRLYEIDPASTLARDSSYDVVALYESQQNTQGAIEQLETFRSRYTNELGDEIALRLVGLKETQGDWLGAAQELIQISESTSGETSSAARYRAAELYLQLDDVDKAIEHFRFYAHEFAEPVALRFEAMNHMDELYQRTDEPSKRDYWLRKKRDLYETLSAEQQSERLKFLAANARFELSRANFNAFAKVKLSLPLARSLKKKQNLLQKSLRAYDAVAQIGVFEYVTKSQFQKAKLYQILAKDLLLAEQPKNLNALEQEQYLLLLEEQAYPFEEQAIALHEQNLRYGWDVSWNEAVDQSLAELEKYSPARFRRVEQEVDYVATSR